MNATKQLRIDAWKCQDFNRVWTCDLAIPVRCSNQLSYEATDVRCWSFVSSNEPVKNGCELIYETFHISLHSSLCLIYYVEILSRNPVISKIKTSNSASNSTLTLLTWRYFTFVYDRLLAQVILVWVAQHLLLSTKRTIILRMPGRIFKVF